MLRTVVRVKPIISGAVPITHDAWVDAAGHGVGGQVSLLESSVMTAGEKLPLVVTVGEKLPSLNIKIFICFRYTA